MRLWVEQFVRESNKIERIFRDPTQKEIVATDAFFDLEQLFVGDIKNLARVYAGSKGVIRNYPGMNVRVGNHIAPPGGPAIVEQLEELCNRINKGGESPYFVHHEYETLHPFLDGNGRTGRAVWAWMMLEEGRAQWIIDLGFLHSWYYQSLEHAR